MDRLLAAIERNLDKILNVREIVWFRIVQWGLITAVLAYGLIRCVKDIADGYWWVKALVEIVPYLLIAGLIWLGGNFIIRRLKR